MFGNDVSRIPFENFCCFEVRVRVFSVGANSILSETTMAESFYLMPFVNAGFSESHPRRLQEPKPEAGADFS
jgi:hypothetical protein